MTNKDKLKNRVSLLIGEALLEYTQSFNSPNILYDLQKEYSEKILVVIDSLQEEPVSIWHDVCEIPKSGTNILMIRKDENDSNYPPIAGCFHGTNSRLDGRNWGYYNGFCYNEIEPPVKWAYLDDILNLSNVERTVKNRKEEPVSDDFKLFEKEYLEKEEDEILCVYDRHAGLVDGAQWQKEQFEKNRLKHCNSITNEQAELEQGFIDQHLNKYQRIPTFLDAIEYGMRLQKLQMIEKACKWLDENAAKYLIDKSVHGVKMTGLDTSFTEDFKKAMKA